MLIQRMRVRAFMHSPWECVHVDRIGMCVGFEAYRLNGTTYEVNGRRINLDSLRPTTGTNTRMNLK